MYRLYRPTLLTVTWGFFFLQVSRAFTLDFIFLGLFSSAMADNTRGKEKVSAIIKDIVNDPRFLSVIESQLVKHLSEMKVTLDKHEGSILELESTLKSKNIEIQQLQSQLEKQNNTVVRLQNRLNHQEQYERRNCLRFFGIPEKAGEVTDDLVIQVAKDIGVDLSKADLERSHRVGKPRNNKPRAIIAKFVSYRKRAEVMHERRKLAGSRKSIMEDLTAPNAELLSYAISNDTVKAAWSLDGRIFAVGKAPGCQKKLIKTKTDIDKL